MSELEFTLPDVGEGLSEAEIVEWHVAPGTRVRRDQAVVDMETDKSVVQLPAPYDGVVVRLAGEVGEIVQVGTVLFVLETDEAPAGTSGNGEANGVSQRLEAKRPEASDGASEDTPVTAASKPAVSGAAPGPTPTRRLLASPATRHLALELDLDLAGVSGSGPGGRITNDDVRAAAAAAEAPVQESAPGRRAPGRPAPAPLSGGTAAPLSSGASEVVPLRGLRRQIAKTMTTAWRDVPHITDIREIDATALVAARERLRDHLRLDGLPFTYLPLFVKAVVATLQTHPKFNASVDMAAETITYHGRYNIGLATATDDGLIVPVLKDADTRSLADIARDVHVLTTSARARSLPVCQLNEGTFTITNFGTFGGWIATPIIRPPESAIAGFGRIRDRVVAVDGQAVVRPVLPLSVSADHRLIDGDDMGGFLNTISALLADPVLLLGGA